ncbi:hypothetical protein BDZ91DRAFT_721634 [Kalaharituber pfeilii]|nr:hypothetical protein BDZ91DRAFT_721634 [Kalaharituber pfeilii]
MGWLFGPSSPAPADSSKPSEDPVASLDPSLREYFESQSRDRSATHPQARPKPPSPHSAPETGPQADPQPSHAASAYGDRYADLWKTYKPYDDEAYVSDQARVAEVMHAHRNRKSAISRAALENCVELQVELNECYRKGSAWSKLTSCSKQAHQLNECYTTQMKLLKALGYMADLARPSEVDERIQMHADRLYQEQLAKDRANEEALRRKWGGGGAGGAGGGDACASAGAGYSECFDKMNAKKEKKEEESHSSVMNGFLTSWGLGKGDSGVGSTRIGGVEVIVTPKKEGEEVS